MKFTVSMMILAYEQIVSHKDAGTSKSHAMTGKSLLLQIGLEEAPNYLHRTLDKDSQDPVNTTVKTTNNMDNSELDVLPATPAKTLASPAKSTALAPLHKSVSMSNRASLYSHSADIDKSRLARLGRLGVEGSVHGLGNQKVIQDEGRSFPFQSLGELNRKALKRIRAQYALQGVKLDIKQSAAFVMHTVSYIFAGIIMFPGMPCETHAAGGVGQFDGVDARTFSPSYWEVAITALSLAQVFLEVQYFQVLVDGRMRGVPAQVIIDMWDEAKPMYMGMFVPIFCIDAAMKIIAFRGPRGYLGTALNRVDFVATLLDTIGSLSWRLPNMCSLRIFRWLVMLYLCRRLSSFHRVISKVGSWFNAFSVVIVIFFILLLAISGQQMFAGSSMSSSGTYYFCDFFAACFDVVSLISTDGVSEMMYAGMGAGIQTIVFLVFACFVLKIMILNVMTAVMTHNFEVFPSPSHFQNRHGIELRMTIFPSLRRRNLISTRSSTKSSFPGPCKIPQLLFGTTLIVTARCKRLFASSLHHSSGKSDRNMQSFSLATPFR